MSPPTAPGSSSSSTNTTTSSRAVSCRAARPTATKFRATPSTSLVQQLPSVAVDASGAFVVAWQDASTRDGSQGAVQAQVFGATGAPVGTEFRVNTLTSNS